VPYLSASAVVFQLSLRRGAISSVSSILPFFTRSIIRKSGKSHYIIYGTEKKLRCF